MLKWLAPLLLTALAAAQPTTTRTSGRLTGPPAEARPARFTLKGNLFECQGRINGSTGMHNASQLKVSLTVTNHHRARAFYALHVVVFNEDGDIVGSGGENQLYPQVSGTKGSVQLDLAVARAELKRVSGFQVVLYEDTQLMGKR